VQKKTRIGKHLHGDPLWSLALLDPFGGRGSRGENHLKKIGEQQGEGHKKGGTKDRVKEPLTREGFWTTANRYTRLGGRTAKRICAGDICNGTKTLIIQNGRNLGRKKVRNANPGSPP